MLRNKIGLVITLIIVFAAVVLSENVANAELTSEELIDYSLNDIMFYSPCGTESSSNTLSGEISITGSTAEQKVWSGLESFLSDEQAAGVMGNIGQEDGNYNPVRREVGQSGDLYNRNVQMGLGFVQWSFGRRVDLLNYIKERDESLIKYFEDDSLAQISGDDFIKKVGENDANKIFQLEIEYIKYEIDRSYQEYYSINDIDEATVWFRENYERAGVYSDSYRKQKAHEAFDKYAGKTYTSSITKDYTSTTSSRGRRGGSVGSSKAGSNAKKLSDMALELAWPKGTDPSKYKEGSGGPTDAIKEAWKKLGTYDENMDHGSDCGYFVQTVVAYSNVDPGFTEKYGSSDTFNLHRWAEKHPENWEVIDFTDGDTSKLQAGDVVDMPGHVEMIADIDGELYEVEAQYGGSTWGHVSDKLEGSLTMSPRGQQTIYRVKGGAPACNSCEQGSMNINGAGACLAWPLGTPESDYSKKVNSNAAPTPAFLDALNTMKRDMHNYLRAPYCSGFTAVVVWWSGYDDKFTPNMEQGSNKTTQADEAAKQGDKWKIIPWNGDKKKLRGGDILNCKSTDHSWMIIEDESGELYVAQGSLGEETYGHISEYETICANAVIIRAEHANNSPAGVSVTDGVKTSSITGKISGGEGFNNGDINASAIELAWPEETPESVYKNQAYDKFVEVFNQLPPESEKSDGGDWSDGRSCMVFVNTVLQYAGAGKAMLEDDEINDRHKKLSSVTNSLVKSDEWEEVGGEGNDGKGLKFKDLKPGDVLSYFGPGGPSDGSTVYKGYGLKHEAIYVETSDGEGRIVEAGWSDTDPSDRWWGHVSHKGSDPNEELVTGWGPMVRVFRWKKGQKGGACDICAGEDDGSMQLKEGGMNLSEAEKFMKPYHDEAEKYGQGYGDVVFQGAFINDGGCSGGPLNNCVAFSQWFVNKYTTLGPNWNHVANGIYLADNLVEDGLKPGTGKDPRPYAIFSSTGISDEGHTGVILGVDKNAKKVIVGEAACSGFKPRAKQYSFDDIKDWKLAYTDGVRTSGGDLKDG